MTTGYVVNLDNGHGGWCVEILRGVTYCGETFDPEAVAREPYALDRGDEHPHNLLCFECSKVDGRRLRGAAREVVA
jgi:hypothetical protein